jgi:hypothetical protein
MTAKKPYRYDAMRRGAYDFRVPRNGALARAAIECCEEAARGSRTAKKRKARQRSNRKAVEK